MRSLTFQDIYFLLFVPHTALLSPGICTERRKTPPMLLTADSTNCLYFLCLLPGLYLGSCISDTDISYSKQKSGSFVSARCLPSITSSFPLLSVCFYPNCSFFFLQGSGMIWNTKSSYASMLGCC